MASLSAAAVFSDIFGVLGEYHGGEPFRAGQLTLEMLDSLPPFEQEAEEIVAAIDVLAREVGRIDAVRARLIANFFPQTADEYLYLQEALLELSINSPDKTLAQRRETILAFERGIRSGGTGTDWEEAMDALIGIGGWTYREHDPDDGTSPPVNVIEVTLPFTEALLAPTGLTATPTTTGGTLSAATRYYKVTAVNAYGETTPGNEASATTTGATGKVTLDWADRTGATSYRVYRGNASGILTYLATVTASTYVDTGASSPTTDGPPSANTSESYKGPEARKLTRRFTPAHIEVNFVYDDQGFRVGDTEIGVGRL